MGADGGAADAGDDGPTDEEVVTAAVEAAEGIVFSRYRTAEVRDVDVTVRFSEGDLVVDVYLHVPDADDVERVADDAALAARDAVDELLE